MVWNTGTVDDFDRLADVTRDPDWDWKHVHPLVKKVRQKFKERNTVLERSHKQRLLDREAYATG
jgi:hypothetical protein